YWPRSYSCSVRMLAQKNLVLPALGNPNSALRQTDSLTKNAADTILQRENVVAAIKQLDLLDRWTTTRQPILRLKDRIVSVLGPRSEENRMRDLIGYLEKRLWVVSDDSSITIGIDWPDRDLSYEIVSFLQKNFLDARYDNNVNVIEEAIRILEERAKPQADEVDAALANLTKIEAERRGVPVGAAVVRGAGGRAPVRRASPSTAGGVATTTPDDTDDTNDSAAAELEDVRRRMRMVKDDRDRQLIQAQNQLADARATLGPMHPTVVALNEKIAQFSAGDPPELQSLRARERQLVAQLAKTPTPPPAGATTAPVVSYGGGGGAGPAPPATAGLRTSAELRDDPEVTAAQARLTAATAKYNDILSRIESARIELDVTRAAFKYQYTVVRPAELPRNPSKPNVLMILVASIAGALLLMVLLPGALDLRRGRILEPWQIERRLGLHVLGELNPPG
ncbi:MAG: hypothetical protein ACRELB_24175, partial [Polyangiaceae bacterium]